MQILLQRVNYAKVVVDGVCIGAIDKGILAFVGLECDDNEGIVQKGLTKLLNYRIFSDSEDKMNLNLSQVDGGLLLVSQFTLAANTKKGNRPSFDTALAPERAEKLFEHFTNLAKEQYQKVATGKFGADMKISLENDGPVTFFLSIN